MIPLITSIYVGIAQLVERRLAMAKVAGSNPVSYSSLRLSGPSGSASYAWLRHPLSSISKTLITSKYRDT